MRDSDEYRNSSRQEHEKNFSPRKRKQQSKRTESYKNKSKHEKTSGDDNDEEEDARNYSFSPGFAPVTPTPDDALNRSWRLQNRESLVSVL